MTDTGYGQLENMHVYASIRVYTHYAHTLKMI